MTTTYWDLTEAERAALTRDEVAKFVDYELMEKGVIKPKALALVDVPEVRLERATFYEIDSHVSGFGLLAFRSPDDARAFIALRPIAVDCDWSIGSETKFATPLREDAQIKTVQVASRESVEAARATLKEASAAKAENERRAKEHQEQQRKVEQALKGLWDDWHACVAKDAAMRRVLETFAEYRGTAGGDVAIAARFLRKAFALDVIREAEAWTQTKMTGLGEGDVPRPAPIVNDDHAEPAVF